MSSTQYADVTTRLDNLADSELSPANVAAIREFIDHCAAEGISEVRQTRLISALKQTVLKCAPDGFELADASEAELKQVIAALHRSDYADSTQHTMKSAVKKFYRVRHDGHDQPEKTKFFSVQTGDATTVSREDLLTADERTQLFAAFSNVRDRAFTKVMYETAARPGECLQLNLGDFTSNANGDFISLQGLKNSPDRTNQLVRAGRTLREWIYHHPHGGEIGDITDPSAPLWVKTEQHACKHCGIIPHQHDDEACTYEPNRAERMKYDGYLRRFKEACKRADIPENKRRPYNLRHTRLTEVATFMGYEQLNKFAGWKPGSDRAKVYVHLTNDDVNQAIRDEYDLATDDEQDTTISCPFCNASNQSDHVECRQCGRPLSMEESSTKKEKMAVLDRLRELEERGVLDKLDELEEVIE